MSKKKAKKTKKVDKKVDKKQTVTVREVDHIGGRPSERTKKK